MCQETRTFFVCFALPNPWFRWICMYICGYMYTCKGKYIYTYTPCLAKIMCIYMYVCSMHSICMYHSYVVQMLIGVLHQEVLNSFGGDLLCRVDAISDLLNSDCCEVRQAIRLVLDHVWPKNANKDCTTLETTKLDECAATQGKSNVGETRICEANMVQVCKTAPCILETMTGHTENIVSNLGQQLKLILYHLNLNHHRGGCSGRRMADSKIRGHASPAENLELSCRENWGCPRTHLQLAGWECIQTFLQVWQESRELHQNDGRPR